MATRVELRFGRTKGFDADFSAAAEKHANVRLSRIIEPIKAMLTLPGVHVEEAVRKGLKPIWNKSQRIVPQKTGALKASGRFEVEREDDGEINVLMSYGNNKVDYAAIVHERTDIKHPPPTQAKYLEQPWEEGLGEAYAYIKQQVILLLQHRISNFDKENIPGKTLTKSQRRFHENYLEAKKRGNKFSEADVDDFKDIGDYGNTTSFYALLEKDNKLFNMMKDGELPDNVIDDYINEIQDTRVNPWADAGGFDGDEIDGRHKPGGVYRQREILTTSFGNGPKSDTQLIKGTPDYLKAQRDASFSRWRMKQSEHSDLFGPLSTGYSTTQWTQITAKEYSQFLKSYTQFNYMSPLDIKARFHNRAIAMDQYYSSGKFGKDMVEKHRLGFTPHASYYGPELKSWAPSNQHELFHYKRSFDDTLNYYDTKPEYWGHKYGKSGYEFTYKLGEGKLISTTSLSGYEFDYYTIRDDYGKSGRQVGYERFNRYDEPPQLIQQMMREERLSMRRHAQRLDPNYIDDSHSLSSTYSRPRSRYEKWHDSFGTKGPTTVNKLIWRHRKIREADYLLRFRNALPRYSPNDPVSSFIGSSNDPLSSVDDYLSYRKPWIR